MMISSAGASDPYAAAAFDRQLRASTDDPGEPSPDSSLVAAGPDVVVTLGKAPPSSGTYDASGRLDGSMSLDELGANAPRSTTQATETDGAGDDLTDASTGAASDAGSDASSVDQDAAVAA